MKQNLQSSDSSSAAIHLSMEFIIVNSYEKH